MERFDYYSSSSQQRESVLLGVSNREIERACFTSPSTPSRNSDVDFTDVFGGPPRRSSVNEIRHSLSGLQLKDSSGEEEGEGGEAEAISCAWPREGEKPVFGEDSGIRRRYPKKNNDFFDDIFGGDESPRVLSPARPLPELVASSLPSAFSLPAKCGDLPTFGSSTRCKNPLNNIKEGTATSNGLASSDFHLSRFSPQATKRKEESKNDSKPPRRQSLLSKEFSDISDKADKGSNMKQDQSVSEASPDSNSHGHFHFSIHKWASKGVPLVMPLRTERKEKIKIGRSSSTKELNITEITTQNDSPIANGTSFLSKSRKQDGSSTYTTIQNGADLHQIAEQLASAKAQSDALGSIETVIKDVTGNSMSSDSRAYLSTNSVSETSFSGKTESARENQKIESKSLRSLLSEIDEKKDYDEITGRERREDSKTKGTKKPSAIFDVNMNTKRSEEKKVPLDGLEHSKAASASQGSLGLAKNMGKDQVKGKVKEFVRIFNQEAATEPRVDSKSKGSTYKRRDALRKNEVEGHPKQSKKENSAVGSSDMSANNLSPQDDILTSAVPDNSFADIGDTDQSFHGNFTIEVLAEDEKEVVQKQDNQEIQVIDNKIQQWSKGKEGNIRSLLSTLQYVLWPECGWKPVPLVDIIEGNAVKRTYQRALLCLHPDKLQQKGAASDQKYIAEKVFDILQEAWTQFNLIGAL